MNDKNFKRHMAYEALVILGLLALLTYMTRLWPILLLIILGIFIATLRLLFLSCKKVEPVKPTLALPPPSAPPTETDMQSIAYAIIQRRITQILRDRFPEVRWIWENPKAKEDIMIGNPVYVLLNRAGGYRRGRVVIQNLTVAEKLKAYIDTHPLDLGEGDCETVLDQLYQAYAESHESDPPEIRDSFKELDELLGALPLDDNNAVFNLCCSLCTAYERKAFQDGVQYGAHLMKELL